MPEFFEEPENDENNESGLENELENLNSFQSAVPEGAYVTIRNGASNPVFVSLRGAEEGSPAETSITVREAITRAGLALSPATTIYVENNVVDYSYVLAAGAVVTIVGSVKGG